MDYRYIISVLPALIGFASVGFLPHVPIRLMFEIFGFVGLAGVDYVAFKRNLFPRWFINIRAWLSFVVVGCLSANLWFFYRRDSIL
jgi:hypothetical protein